MRKIYILSLINLKKNILNWKKINIKESSLLHEILYLSFWSLNFSKYHYLCCFDQYLYLLSFPSLKYYQKFWDEVLSLSHTFLIEYLYLYSFDQYILAIIFYSYQTVSEMYIFHTLIKLPPTILTIVVCGLMGSVCISLWFV